MPTIRSRSGDSVQYDHESLNLLAATRGMVENPARPSPVPDNVAGDVSNVLSGSYGLPDHGGFLMPLDALGLRKRNLSLATGSAFVGSRVAPATEFTDVLRRKSAASILGVRYPYLWGVNGSPLPIPSKSTAATVAWIADGTPAPATWPEYVAGTAETQTLAASVVVERKQWRSMTDDAHDAVILDLAAGFAAEVDRAVIAGAGTLEPIGLLSLSGTLAQAFGANGGAPTRAALIAAMKAVHAANGDAGASPSMGWVASPAGEAKLRSVDGSAGNAGAWLWSDGDRILGKPAVSTTAVPDNLTKGSGSNLSALIYGNWSDVLVNLPPAAAIQVDPRTYLDGGAVRITAFLDVQIIVRHAASFAVFKDMVTA